LQHKGEFKMENLLILGGGYGGMKLLNEILPSHVPENVMITLVDRVPYHCLKTEFYALAAGTISDKEVRVTFPEHPQLQYKYGEITRINMEEKKVILDEKQELKYDDLIIGLGCEDKYHNVPGADQFTYSIQSIESARTTYSILNNLGPGSIVGIVGAGLSGVELSSELSESRPDLQVKLFSRGEHILSDFPVKLSKYVENWFNEHNIEVINHSNITRVEKNTLYNHDEPVQCDVIVWTAGIQANKIVRDLNVEQDPSGRVKITPHHHLPTDEHVFIVGDCASLPHAPSAQLAEGQAEQIAEVFKLRWKNEPLPAAFPPIKLKGVLGSLGKKHGFGMMADRPITGRVARLLKSGILWMYKYHNG
jgi:NADH:ubiquinone reductase (H+-translocating)